MYRTCLHCHAALGSNDVIEHFPVGRRLAFDSSKGRLWVVCDKCRRWNLTPVEERWEAIEECEREFSRTRLRVSTDSIAVARVPEGLDLVRVGGPTFPELAAWRYGRSLHKRWRNRVLPLTALSMSGYLGQLLLNAHIVGLVGSLGLIGISFAPMLFLEWRQGRVQVMLPDGRRVTISYREKKSLELEPDADGWALRLSSGDTTTRVTGTSATHSLRGVLTAANFFGGRKSEIDGGIALLHNSGSASRYISRVAAAGRDTGAASIDHLPPEVRLGLEMALHEEAERRALDGELAGLREEWQLAEEVAKIADDMFLPAGLLQRLNRLKGAEGSL